MLYTFKHEIMFNPASRQGSDLVPLSHNSSDKTLEPLHLLPFFYILLIHNNEKVKPVKHAKYCSLWPLFCCNKLADNIEPILRTIIQFCPGQKKH